MEKKVAVKVAEVLGSFLKKELEFTAESTGSLIAYQPVVPKELEKFEKRC
ncbi:MAG: AgrD family cyclic lactone autoinducer peptide [Acetatifactor sp.]